MRVHPFIAAMLILCPSLATAAAVPRGCVGDATFATWTTSCSVDDASRVLCVVATHSDGSEFGMAFRSVPKSLEPDARILFRASDLATTPGDRIVVRVKHGKDAELTSTATAMDPSIGLVSAFDVADVAFWLATPPGPVELDYRTPTQSWAFTFPHKDFTDAVTRMLVCFPTK